MPRPRCCRRVAHEPQVTVFKPAGIRMADLEQVALTVDELEALRLKDLEGLEQVECARNMNISQPTFHRLIVEARSKVADAIVRGKALTIGGGNFIIHHDGKRCRRGGCRHESSNSE